MGKGKEICYEPTEQTFENVQEVSLGTCSIATLTTRG